MRLSPPFAILTITWASLGFIGTSFGPTDFSTADLPLDLLALMGNVRDGGDMLVVSKNTIDVPGLLVDFSGSFTRPAGAVAVNVNFDYRSHGGAVTIVQGNPPAVGVYPFSVTNLPIDTLFNTDQLLIWDCEGASVSAPFNSLALTKFLLHF